MRMKSSIALIAGIRLPGVTATDLDGTWCTSDDRTCLETSNGRYVWTVGQCVEGEPCLYSAAARWTAHGLRVGMLDGYPESYTLDLEYRPHVTR
jgi:hypothetical protein